MLMLLINTKTEERYVGEIDKVQAQDFDSIRKEKEFIFDWSKEAEHKVFKIKIAKSKQVLGLISIIDIPEELRIHINLVEVTKENTGKNKKIRNISGCLIAYACKIAFEKGYGGFVSLIPKTQLIKHYQNFYGFIPTGHHLVLFLEASKAMISKYLDDEKV